MATCVYCHSPHAEHVDLDSMPICASCTDPNMVICPACNGQGGQQVLWHNGLNYWSPCGVCDESVRDPQGRRCVMGVGEFPRCEQCGRVINAWGRVCAVCLAGEEKEDHRGER